MSTPSFSMLRRLDKGNIKTIDDRRDAVDASAWKLRMSGSSECCGISRLTSTVAIQTLNSNDLRWLLSVHIGI